jgi:hypothetical protein
MPKKGDETGRHLKLTVVLLQRHVAALDRLAVNIRLRSGVALSRASIIDAFIAASVQKPTRAIVEMLQSRVSVRKDNSHKKWRQENDALSPTLPKG